jgi:hypothetical protein
VILSHVIPASVALKIWRYLLLLQAKGLPNLSLSEWPYFSNGAIERSLSIDARKEIVQVRLSLNDSMQSCIAVYLNPSVFSHTHFITISDLRRVVSLCKRVWCRAAVASGGMTRA